MVTLSAVESFVQILIHNAILFINTSTMLETTKVIGYLGCHISLADPGGPWGHGPSPPTPRFGGLSYTVWRSHCKFKSEIMNFEPLFFVLSKKISSFSSLSINVIFFYILLVSLCSLFHFLMCILLYYIMCICLHYIDSSHNLSCL